MKLIFCADKGQSFLQVHTIIFDGRYQPCLNYLKQQVCNIFAISQERSER